MFWTLVISLMLQVVWPLYKTNIALVSGSNLPWNLPVSLGLTLALAVITPSSLVKI